MKHLALPVTLTLIATACGGGSSSGSGNSAPQFAQSSYNFTLAEDDSFSGSITATDDDRDELSYIVASAGSLGTLSIAGNGSFSYQPDQDKHGTDNVVVQVSDGSASAEATLTFTIEPVNDAPVLLSTNIAVAAGSTYSGQLDIEDADNDPITLTLVEDASHGELDLNLNSGAFTYVSEATEEVSDTFVISFSDGIVDPIEATITIAPSYASNADKLAYYYAWDQSHLAKAESALAQIDDDLAVANTKIHLAKGYFLAGLYDVGTARLESIGALEVRAEGYRQAALVLDGHRDYERANQLRQTASTLYNQYMAEKGIANLSSDDASFYQGVVKEYRAIGALEQASQLVSTLSNFADTIREEENTNAYGRLSNAYSASASAAIERYLNNPTEENRLFAKQLVDEYAVIADGTGYNYDDDYNPPYKYRTKVSTMATVASYYDNLNEAELAKEYLARGVALYSDVSYDPDYNRAASNYAANTLDDYDSPLEDLARVFASQYPQLETNVPAALIFQRNPDDSTNEGAAEQVFMVKAAQSILEDGASLEEATADAEAYFTEGENLQGLFWMLMEAQGAPTLAFRLYRAGETELAKATLLKAQQVLLSSAFGEQSFVTRWSSGNQGCDRLVQIYVSWFGDASEVVAGCQTLIDELFADDSDWDTDGLIDARSDLMHAYFQNRDYADFSDEANSLYSEMTTFASYFEEPLDRIEYYADIASLMASYGLSEKAVSAWALARDEIDSLLDPLQLGADELGDLLDDVLLTFATGNDQLVSNGSAYPFREVYLIDTALRRNYGSMDHQLVAIALAQYRASLAELAASISTAASTFSVNEQQNIRGMLVNFVQAAGLEAQAADLAAEEEINAPADHTDLWQSIAEHFALEDAFPASNIANVDTDGDGLPNFFFTTATAEDIAASGLVADDDADDDGIDDAADAAPLEADL